jgi:site-specific DNA recombinase
LGYLNTREFVDGFSVSRVILDPERAPILRWCLDQYATGEWRVESGRHRVGHSGPREGAYHPTDAGQGNGADQHHDDFQPAAQPVLHGHHRLTNGFHYEGKHEPLVTPEKWLRIQDVLSAHRHAGENLRRTTADVAASA